MSCQYLRVEHSLMRFTGHSTRLANPFVPARSAQTATIPNKTWTSGLWVREPLMPLGSLASPPFVLLASLPSCSYQPSRLGMLDEAPGRFELDRLKTLHRRHTGLHSLNTRHV